MPLLWLSSLATENSLLSVTPHETPDLKLKLMPALRCAVEKEGLIAFPFSF
jgi:hypothetical protein